MKHLLKPFLWLLVAFMLPMVSGCFFYGFGHHHHRDWDDGGHGHHHDRGDWHDRW